MEKNILLFASFLHDIGKFKQRGENIRDIKRHHLEGKEVCDILINLWYKDRITKLIEKHHEQNYQEEDKLFYILQISDWLASSEREREEEEEGQIESKTQQSSSTYSLLINPMSRERPAKENKENIENEKFTYFDITTIDNPQITEDNTENFLKYKELWKYFENEARIIQNMKDENKIFEIIFYLSKKYTWAIPSATYYSGNFPSISLFDHSQAVAAYSLGLYEADWKNEELIRLIKDLRENFKKDNRKKIVIEELKEKELIKRKPFLFVAGDISGIQNYVYWSGKGSKSQHRAKQLRGRSFLLRLIEDSIIYKIKEELDLPPVCILQKGGGRILLLIPNTAEKKQKLEKIRDELQKLLILQYGGKIKLNLAIVETSIEDVLKGYGEIEKKIKKGMIVAKSLGAKVIFSDQEFQDELKVLNYQKEKCTQCEGPIGDKKYEIVREFIDKEGRRNEPIRGCYNCKMEYEIGNRIAKIENYYLRIICGDGEDKYNRGQVFSPISGSGIYYYFPLKKEEEKEIFQQINKNEKTKVFIIQINKTKPLGEIYRDKQDISQQINSVEFELIGNYWKTTENIEIETNKIERFSFEEMAKANKQQYLGWVKIDGDSLGTYFEKIERLSEYCFSSRALEIFFCGQINKILEEYEPGEFSKEDTLIKEKGYPGYIVFSGGDDLFLVGSWVHTLEVVDKIAQEYSKYTANKKTFSAGFALTTLAFPIQLANSLVDREEKNAKNYKNSIGLFEVVVDLTNKSANIKLSDLFEHVKKIENNLPTPKEEFGSTKKTTLIRNIYDILEDGMQKENKNKIYRGHYLPFLYNILIKSYDLGEKNREIELKKFEEVKSVILELSKKSLKLAQVPLTLYLLKNREKRGE
ncbi:MAG: type III-A CRISPR-associated protein Cas10/Csm1 [Candidatus Anstonellaceae archaeon]